MIPQFNIFDAARENSDQLESDCAKKLTQDETNNIDKYVRCSLISINRKISGVFDFLMTNKFETGYEYCLRISGKQESERFSEDTVADFETFREMLQLIWSTAPSCFTQRRAYFKSNIASGGKHLFGALNFGNAGPAAKDSAYGEYCIVFKQSVFEGDLSIAHCKYDTLDYDAYWTCNAKSEKPITEQDEYCKKCEAKRLRFHEARCRLDWDNLRPAYAAHSHRGHLAVLKEKETGNHPRVTSRPGKTEEYIEVCFTRSVTPDDVEVIRFHPALGKQLFFEAFVEEIDPIAKNIPYEGISHVRRHTELKNILQERSINFEYERAE